MVYAVNRALITVPDADWLSAGDMPIFQGLLPAGLRPAVGVVTMDDVADHLRRQPGWSLLRLVGWGGVQMIAAHAARGRPLAWSVQVALCHAAESATSIDLYGCDGAAGGTPIDCTGYTGPDRSDERWAREELDLAVTVDLIAARGVTVHRI
ncbi:hypothetical protein [Methylibium sp.]|uniref:hypothetical protein n=1 Tax=Methylibium sp. TaxID=2067992 RepID=UPI0017C29AC8|nr:hypothetical protein [Methylibium sp.]MBA3589962.1 hypothetical protein [Methylibium sp.]